MAPCVNERPFTAFHRRRNLPPMSSLTLVGSLLGILLASVLGALPPMLGRWSDRQLHLFIAFGAGVFLGAVFFHLVPKAIANHPGNLTNAMILLGFTVVLLVERVVLGRPQSSDEGLGQQRHHVLGISAFVGLSLHSLTEGFALGTGVAAPQLAAVLVLAIMSHKAVAAFSLATVFRLSNIPRKQAVIMLGVFAGLTPLGALLSALLVNALSLSQTAIPTALAAGTFIYVATMDLLPEAFHTGQKRLITFAALSLGIFAMLAVDWLDV